MISFHISLYYFIILISSVSVFCPPPSPLHSCQPGTAGGEGGWTKAAGSATLVVRMGTRRSAALPSPSSALRWHGSALRRLFWLPEPMMLRMSG